MSSLYFLDLAETINKLNERVEAFLNENYQNPIFWAVLCCCLFCLAAWAIGYFNRN